LQHALLSSTFAAQMQHVLQVRCYAVHLQHKCSADAARAAVQRMLHLRCGLVRVSVSEKNK
jgi:hypothetical protein